MPAKRLQQISSLCDAQKKKKQAGTDLCTGSEVLAKVDDKFAEKLMKSEIAGQMQEAIAKKEVADSLMVWS